MEEKVNNKGNKLYIGVIVLLLVVILGLVVFILNDKESPAKNKNKNDVVEKDTGTKNVLLDIDSDDVKNAMKSFKNIFISDGNLYKNNSYKIDSISNEDLIASVIKLVGQEYIVSNCESRERKSVSMEYLNNELSKYFTNKKITMDNIKSLSKAESYPNADYEVNGIGIIIDGNNIKLVGPCGMEFNTKPFTSRKIIKAEQDKNYLYVYEKIAFAKFAGESETKKDAYGNPSFVYDYYKDYQNKEKLETNLLKSENPNLDLYNTYKYTFKKQDNNYYFIKLELDK